MNTFRTDVNAWLHEHTHVVQGRPFPYGEFSCIPLAPEDPGAEEEPVGFLLSKGKEVTIVTHQPDGSNDPLWGHLVEEMTHWHAYPAQGYDDLPPECWYG